MSQLPSDLPQLPKWPFLCADAVLLGTATLIASFSNTPTQGWPLIVVVSCVVVACVLCAIPFLTDYARSQDQLLDERQRALEGLAKSVAGSAEQISIAVQGLGRLDDQLQRHLRQIDQVPQKINERLGDLQQRLASTQEGEIEELERELAALKSSEGDRLESVMDQLQRATAELARLEQSAARHAEQARVQGAAFQSSSAEALSRLTTASAEASARLSASIDQSLLRSGEMVAVALSSARAEIDALLAEARQRSTRDWDLRAASFHSLSDKASLVSEQRLAQIEQAALTTAQRLEELDKASLASSLRLLDFERISNASAQRLEALALRFEQRLEDASQGLGKVSEDLRVQAIATQAALAAQAAQALSLAPAAMATPESLPSGPVSDQAVPSLRAELPTADVMPAATALAESIVVHVSEEDPSLSAKVSEAALEPAPSAEAPSVPEKPAAAPERVTRKAVSNKKLQAAAAAPQVASVAVEPEAAPVPLPAQASAEASAPAALAESPEAQPAADASKGRQPRKKPEPVPAGMVLDLFNENFSLEDHHEEPLVSRAVSADGATRIIVTAYIGIGNKLFIRGDGPGLSWERGQPLQFVSIGKWRWESLEAESTFRFKLYKNDQLECTALGQQHIDAGQQTELTANF